MGGKKSNFIGCQDKGREVRQQERDGVELFKTEAGGRLALW